MELSSSLALGILSSEFNLNTLVNFNMTGFVSVSPDARFEAMIFLLGQLS